MNIIKRSKWFFALLVCLAVAQQIRPFLAIHSDYYSIIKEKLDVPLEQVVVLNTKTKYDDEYYEGLLSKKPTSFFRKLQKEIDDRDHKERCERYGYSYNSTHPKKRRIFYGTPIAEDSWELLEIIAAESYGILDGMVFVESNRTHLGNPRKLRWYNDGKKTQQLKQLFGVSNLQIRLHVDETQLGAGLLRQHALRQAVVSGWKDLGMTVDDVGYLVDADETFTRDALRAVQVCHNIPPLDDYESHRCYNPTARINCLPRIYQSSPLCSQQNPGWKPHMIIGACVHGIGDSNKHPLAPREGYHRAKGYGRDCTDFENLPTAAETDGKRNYPIYTAGDIRTACGGQFMQDVKALDASENAKRMGKKDNETLDIPFRYSGYHLHNFFANISTLRHKYLTYGEPVNEQRAKGPLKNIAPALDMMVKCVKDIPNDLTNPKSLKRNNAFGIQRQPIPIYFHDTEYSQKKQQQLLEYVLADEKEFGAN